jgi:nucleoside 2-deoxyribosyltransferase
LTPHSAVSRAVAHSSTLSYFSGNRGRRTLAAKPFAFVLMPFDAQFQDIYKLGIQSVANECGVVAERVDEQTFSETILERIYRQIENSDFVIADMTGRNPNVFYEVGYAHARGKLVTLLTQSAEDIPFDLRHHRHIVYNGSIQTLRQKLQVEIEWLKEQMEKQSTNAFTIELCEVDGVLKKTSWSADAVVEFVFDINNKTKRKSPDIEAIYLYTGKNWAFKQGGEDCPSTATDENKNRTRHFIRSPVPRLSPGAWAQVKVIGTKRVWSKYSGEELKEKYTSSGFVTLELSTSEGIFKEQMDISVEVEEFPF